MKSGPSFSVCVASHNTLTNREAGLSSCIHSLNESIQHAQQKLPDCQFTVVWVDDASTDNTLEFARENIKVPLVSSKLKICSQQGYARNLAAKLIDSEYLLFCDSDDVFHKDHIVKAYEAITSTAKDGKRYAVACMSAKTDPSLEIHPDWLPRISFTIPITKIIHRTAWEFVEGFPTGGLYKITSAEDQDLMTLLGSVFQILRSSEETVTYCHYPNSYFDRQLEKFRRTPEEAFLSEDEKRLLPIHQARLTFLNAKLETLKSKLLHTDWREKLCPFATAFTLSDEGAS